jgi:hypothetical protein
LASLLIEREKGDGLSNTTRSRFTVDRRSNEESLPKTHKKNVVGIDDNVIKEFIVGFLSFQVCVGAAIVDFEVFTSDPPCQQGKGSTIGGGLYNPAKILQKCGGVARNHCLC